MLTLLTRQPPQSSAAAALTVCIIALALLAAAPAPASTSASSRRPVTVLLHKCVQRSVKLHLRVHLALKCPSLKDKNLGNARWPALPKEELLDGLPYANPETPALLYFGREGALIA